MNITKILSLLLLLSSIALFSCGNNTTSTETSNTVAMEQVVGNWQITEASRDGQVTETLNGLFFRFSKDGKLMTNLLGSEVEMPFELTGNKIIQKSTPPLEFIVEETNEKKLVISTTLQEMNFKIVLKKDE